MLVSPPLISHIIHKDIHMHITVECMHVCVYICQHYMQNHVYNVLTIEQYTCHVLTIYTIHYFSETYYLLIFTPHFHPASPNPPPPHTVRFIYVVRSGLGLVVYSCQL